MLRYPSVIRPAYLTCSILSLVYLDSMNTLPQEIKDHIVKYACDNRVNARNCMLVEKAFLPQARDMVFGTLNVSGGSHYGPGARFRSAHRVVEELKQLPDIQGHVRTIIFHSVIFDDNLDVPYLCYLLDNLPRIKELVLRGVTFDDISDAPVKRLMSSLVHVESLQLRRCHMSAGTFDTWFSSMLILHLRITDASINRVNHTELNVLRLRLSIIRANPANTSLTKSIIAFSHLHTFHFVLSRFNSAEDKTMYKWLESADFSALSHLHVTMRLSGELCIAAMILHSAVNLSTLGIRFCSVSIFKLSLSFLTNFDYSDRV